MMLKDGQSLFVRSALVLVTCIMLSLLISNSVWWLYISQEEQRNATIEVQHLATDIQVNIDKLNQLRGVQRDLVVDALNQVGMYNYGSVSFLVLRPVAQIVDALPHDELTHDKSPSALLEKRLTASSAGNIRIGMTAMTPSLSQLLYGDVEIVTGSEVEADYFADDYVENDAEDDYPAPLLEDLLFIHESLPERVMVIQTQLNDGQWAVLFITGLFEKTHFLDILSPLNIVIMASSVPFMIIFLFFAVRWINNPLLNLAKKAEAIGDNILVKQAQTINGPHEVKHIESALLTMQERIIDQIEHSHHGFAAMSHDLKTPLTRMRIRAEMLDNDSIRLKFVDDIERLEKMITSALNYTKNIEMIENKQQIDMNALFQSIADDMADLGKRVNISGRCNKPFLGYPIALRSCFTNVIENAVFYGKQADVYLVESKGLLTVTMLDNGPGIPEAELAKVLVPYYRLDESRSLNTGGSGLGLSIANKAVQAHMGVLSLINRLNTSGLKVQVLLPIHSL